MHANFAFTLLIQVYNETICDLLVPSGPLNLREDPLKGTYIIHCISHDCHVTFFPRIRVGGEWIE